MEHVFGRYVECPYSTRTLFFNRECRPLTIKNKINPNVQDLWIDAIPGFENYLYYDPICGKDKVITVGDTFSNGGKLHKDSYISCTSLMYYFYDIHENGERELDFNKIGVLISSIISKTDIEDSGLSIKYSDYSIDKFVNCFTNFYGKEVMRKVLTDFEWIYKKGGDSKKKIEFKADCYNIWTADNKGRCNDLVDTIYY